MLKTTCPECDAEVRFDTAPKVGDQMACAHCRSELAVIKANPIVLDWAFVDPFTKPNSSTKKKPLLTQ